MFFLLIQNHLKLVAKQYQASQIIASVVVGIHITQASKGPFVVLFDILFPFSPATRSYTFYTLKTAIKISFLWPIIKGPPRGGATGSASIIDHLGFASFPSHTELWLIDDTADYRWSIGEKKSGRGWGGGRGRVQGPNNQQLRAHKQIPTGF